MRVSNRIIPPSELREAASVLGRQLEVGQRDRNLLGVYTSEGLAEHR